MFSFQETLENKKGEKMEGAMTEKSLF